MSTPVLPSPPKTSNDLRRAFLDYFAANGHNEVASASLIPFDPTVLFTVAGMVPFKSYFTGDETPPFKRAATSQKCARAGGKHNDLDDVGRTARHLVFFEMLGNFSFGDYFKRDAIKFAWEFVTKVLQFDTSKLWVTVHYTDEEAEKLWLELTDMPIERIQRLGDKDNFWQMGPTGPCGPCSEIYIDRGPQYGPEGGPLNPEAEARYLEFWNLVFMQFDQAEDGTRTSLPKPSIDTGAGLERILCLLQDVEAVWETDLMAPIIAKARELTGANYIVGDYQDPDSFSLRVLAEHARSGAMLIADDVFPSNTGRGYVLTRILRRAIRHAYRLGVKRNILPELMNLAVDVMADAYPNVAARRAHILAVVGREEEQFRKTLERGSILLDQLILDAKVLVNTVTSSGVVDGGAEFFSGKLQASNLVSGDAAFELHDTFGFQLELTREICAENGVELDEERFIVLMNEQRDRARAARKNSATPEELAKQYREIQDANGQTVFVGYSENRVDDARVLGVVEIEGGAPGAVEVFLDRTPFYAESGGQMGDTGELLSPTGKLTVTDTTYAVPGLTRHAGILTGTLVVGDTVSAQINVESRDATRRNHTGTHLLHWALRQVLGEHVKQAGSLVGPDRLRFDFSHYDSVTPAQVLEIENLVNDVVLTAAVAENPEVTKAEAEGMGAIAFFGDKYGEKVRVLKAGPSLEFCGGTHVSNVGQIGAVKILGESSIGSNLRRIEASTGTNTIIRLRADQAMLDSAAGALKVKPEELNDRIAKLLDDRKSLEREIEMLKKAAAGGRAAEFAAQAENGIVIAAIDDIDRDTLKDMALAIRDMAGIRAVILGSAPSTGGVTLVSAVTKDSGLHAGELIADAAKTIGGGGGKAPDLAVAGGKKPEGLTEAMAQARKAAGL
jgi:alanyl-tRNA synthetase